MDETSWLSEKDVQGQPQDDEDVKADETQNVSGTYQKVVSESNKKATSIPAPQLKGDCSGSIHARQPPG
jgi:hypothetical protein